MWGNAGVFIYTGGDVTTFTVMALQRAILPNTVMFFLFNLYFFGFLAKDGWMDGVFFTFHLNIHM